MEQTLAELQKHRDDRLARSTTGVSEVTDPPSQPSVPDSDDGRSISSTNFTSDSFVHTSQFTPSSSTGDGAQPAKPKKTKQALWYEMKISGKWRNVLF